MSTVPKTADGMLLDNVIQYRDLWIYRKDTPTLLEEIPTSKTSIPQTDTRQNNMWDPGAKQTTTYF